MEISRIIGLQALFYVTLLIQVSNQRAPANASVIVPHHITFIERLSTATYNEAIHPREQETQPLHCKLLTIDPLLDQVLVTRQKAA